MRVQRVAAISLTPSLFFLHARMVGKRHPPARRRSLSGTQRVTVNVVLCVTDCPVDLAVTVAVAVPAQVVVTFHCQV